jgi:hypothetical protein
MRLLSDPVQSELRLLRLTRFLSAVLQVGAAAAALWICFVALLLLTMLPRMGESMIQKVLMAVVAVSFAASGVFWVLKFRARHLAWLANGTWPADDAPQSQRWTRLATLGWICGFVSLSLLTASFVVW